MVGETWCELPVVESAAGTDVQVHPPSDRKFPQLVEDT
jgi:hypothetical protein